MQDQKEETIQIYQGWDEFSDIEVGDKLEFFSRNGRLFDVIFAQQFDRSFLDFMCGLANQIRTLARTKMGARKLSGLPHSGDARIRNPGYQHKLRGQRGIPGRYDSNLCQLCGFNHHSTPGSGFCRKSRLGSEPNRQARSGYQRRFRTRPAPHAGTAGYIHSREIL